MSPTFHIHLDQLRENSQRLSTYCREHGIEPIAVTKVLCGDQRIVQALVDGGVEILGDSRLENLKKFRTLKKARLCHIRPTNLSEVSEIPSICFRSYQSELAIIKELDAHTPADKKHEIVLFVEMGDLREGIYLEKELYETADWIAGSRNLILRGLAANFNCLNAINPTVDKLETLHRLSLELPETTLLSGGSSGSLRLLFHHELPKPINELRLGAAFLLGKMAGNLPRIDFLHRDSFILEVEVIEVKEKPRQPYGEQGVALRSLRKTKPKEGSSTRVICAVGIQEVEPEALYPLDNRLSILGASSDHLVLEMKKTFPLCPGDRLNFEVDYLSLLKLMSGTTPRHYIEGEYDARLLT